MSSNDPLIGKKLGDYTIESLLGQGGMARVYKGYDEKLDRYAAVKVIEPNLIASEDDEEYRERFLREARAIARLNHPRVVGVFQFGQLEHLYYMAMVFVQGRDLRQILKEYNRQSMFMSHAQVLRVIKDTAEALDYSHSQGVIHRDIKPSNIMVMEDGHSVLTDFGLALSAQEGTIGNTFGSVHYIAPEQAVSSKQAVPQSDLYSLGVVLYEMLTGRVPFEDASAMSVALKHISDPPPPPSSINRSISQEIEEVVMKALDKEPNRRFPSGVALVHALEGAFASSDEEDTHDVDVNTSPPDMEGVKRADTQSRRISTPLERSPEPIMMPALDSITRQGDDASLSDASSHTPGSLPFMPLEEGPSPQEKTQKASRRRSRPLLVLLLLLLLFGLIGALIVSGTLEFGQDDPDATQIAGISSAEPEATEPVTASTRDIETTEATPSASTATDVPSATETTQATVTVEPSATATATDEEDIPEETAASNGTTVETLTSTPMPPINAVSVDSPEILIYYSWEQLIIYNRSINEALYDVRRVSFRDMETDTLFTEAEWQYPDARWQMRAQLDCFQLLDRRYVELNPPDFCSFRQAFERVQDPFWSSPEGKEQFEVLWDGAVVGVCPTVRFDSDEEMRCIFDPVAN